MTIWRSQLNDVAAIAGVFTESVRSTAARDYSPEQIDAWAPVSLDPSDMAEWHRRLARMIAFVAEIESEVAGFVTYEPDGHLDYLYVGSRFQRRGVAAKLCARVEQEALALRLNRIFAEASITARPFFESIGFRVVAEQTVEFRGVFFKNVRMEKVLECGS
jgi:putative acetyltransferase